MMLSRLAKSSHPKHGRGIFDMFMRNKDLIAKLVKVIHGATGAATLAAGAYGVKKLVDAANTKQ